MPQLLEKNEYAFEVSEEVKEKMKNSEDLHRLISEETVQDLKRVYINKRFYCKIKRLMDTLLAACGLLVLVIPFAIVAAIVYIDDPGPVIFSQYRIGRQGKRFKLYKFRTMKLDTPKYLSTMEVEDPDQYITRVGHFLRKMSLDELPQLFNVLKGDMSLVGPRPELMRYVEQYTGEELDILQVRPGITDFSSVEFVNLDEIVGAENADEMYEKLVLGKKNALRVKYAHTVSLGTDLYILYKTAVAVLDKIFGFVFKKEHR